MRGDTKEGVSKEEEHEEITAPTVERRSSVAALENMLKKVSQSPLHNQHPDGEQVPELSAAATDGTDGRRRASEQNGVHSTLATGNPFYQYFLESGSNGQLKENAEWTTSGESNHGGVFVPTYQSSPLDLNSHMKTVERKLPTPPARTPGHLHDRFHTSTLGPNTTANGHFLDVTQNTPELLKTNPVQTQNFSQTASSRSSALFEGPVEDPVQAAGGQDLHRPAGAEDMNFFDKSPSLSVNPFRLASNHDPQPAVGNPFHTSSSSATEAEWFPSPPTKSEEHKRGAPTKEEELFGAYSKKNMDVFSTSSTDTADPFQSPDPRNSFQDVSWLEDPFGSTPSTQSDPFHQDVSGGTPDIFLPLPSKTRDVFEMTSSSTAPEAAYSAPPISSPSERKLDTLSSPDTFKKTPSRPPPPVPPKPFQKPPQTASTTTDEPEQDLLEPTPFTRSRFASRKQSPADMSHVQTFRRPPKPLPRTRPPRPDNPPKPEKQPKPERPPQPAVPIEPEPDVPKPPPEPVIRPISKPVLPQKSKPLDTKPVASENVFEDVLLIGQERCVEDWPEDSPELSPDFKPSGRLKLRRESLKMKMVSGDTGGEDQNDAWSYSKKKDKKFRMSILSKRGSKGKFSDDLEARSRTLSLPRKSSKDFYPDLHVSAGEFEDDQMGVDRKKKPLKSKVDRLLRRSSTASSVFEGKFQNRSSAQEMRRSAFEGSTGEEDEGADAQQEVKGKKKLKMKFVSRRGFSNKGSDEPRGAYGYSPHRGSKDKAPDEMVFAQRTCTPHNKPQGGVLEDTVPQKKKGSFSAEELDSEELNRTEDEFAESETTGKEFMSPGEMFDSEEEEEELETCKPKKSLNLKVFKKHKSKSKVLDMESEDPPGAASSDYMSEAARAEWEAAQRDEQNKEGLEDGSEEGDTDSLMEWWCTVEQWDEVPSEDEEQVIKEDESKSFSVLADKVHRGLRVFNKVFTERAEVLWQSIIMLHAIADDISDFHHKARIAGITGGTTTAVGGVTAIAGLALAPFTFGASLVITAVGVGVATAGGITSASAAISDNVNNMNDRKKVEALLQEYEGHLLDIGKILHFINQGVYKLRGHPFLRSGTQHYSEDWETRRAVQMISLVDSPVMQATDIVDSAVASLQGLFKGMDKYFIKDSRELKKGCKKEIVAQIKEVANVLNDAIVDLNAIREDLQEATGSM